jgi:hypothetical protein
MAEYLGLAVETAPWTRPSLLLYITALRLDGSLHIDDRSVNLSGRMTCVQHWVLSMPRLKLAPKSTPLEESSLGLRTVSEGAYRANLRHVRCMGGPHDSEGEMVQGSSVGLGGLSGFARRSDG